jgi:hypothetical protein
MNTRKIGLKLIQKARILEFEKARRREGKKARILEFEKARRREGENAGMQEYGNARRREGEKLSNIYIAAYLPLCFLLHF